MKDYDETHLNQLLDFAKKYLPNNFQGMIMIDPKSIKIYLEEYPLKNNHFYINLFDHHWTSVIKRNGKMYQFDSFNRNLYGNGLTRILLKQAEKQKVNESTCGQHVLAKLLQIFSMP